MCKSALPERLQHPEAWKGTDDDVWYLRWSLPYKGWNAFGPRDKHWYHRWREMPLTLFAMFGKGDSRWESTASEIRLRSINKTVLFFKPTNVYLSAIQYWCRWSFQIQWPFFIAFHFYFKDTPYPANVTGKMFYFRFGCRRDADIVYWFPSLFIGLTWN